MTSPSIRSATASEQQRAISTIVTAFTSDPITRWVLPEPHEYLTYFTEFVPLMAAGTFEHGAALCTDDFAAASLWLPPNVHSDQEAMAEVAQRAVAERDQEKVFTFMGQMAWYHPNRAPLVSPIHRGRSYASGKRTRLGPPQVRFAELRSRRPARLPRSYEPRQPPPL